MLVSPFLGLFCISGLPSILWFPVLGQAEQHTPALDCFTTYRSYLQYEQGLCPLPVLSAPGMIFMALCALPTSPLVITFYLFTKHTYQRHPQEN